MIEDIKAFNKKFSVPTLPTPGFLSDEDMARRLDFQMEELLETAKAAGFRLAVNVPDGGWAGEDEVFAFEKSKKEYASRNLAEVLDGLVDQAYVLFGTADKMGLLGTLAGMEKKDGAIFSEAWHRVHHANMQKVIVADNWKLQKPEGWKRPNLEDLVS